MIIDRTEVEQRYVTKMIINEYNVADCGAKLGMLSSTTVTTTPIEGDPETRTVEFSYYGSGLLKTETVQPGSNKALTKTYEYKDFGNNSRVVLSGSDCDDTSGSLLICVCSTLLDTNFN